MVGAEVEPVDVRSGLGQLPKHLFMHRLQQGGGKIAARQARLVGHHHHRQPLTIEAGNGGPDAVQELKAADMIDIAHLLVNGAVTVEKDRRSQRHCAVGCVESHHRSSRMVLTAA